MGEKRTVVHVDTGQRLERWPVDAHAMVNTGKWAFEGSESQGPLTTALSSKGEAIPPVPPVRALTIVPPTMTEHSPGVPLVVQRSETAPPAKVQQIPTGRTKSGRR